ncbi:hypothetical protein [Ferrimonas marina]|uniref:Uncharacterized protein n=1 Tax=Ferrimonas marina TaxID=299255 RepID=A0A1M5Z6A1_9GAMM|nr:hypothetical protein [Ferrimonas marina]SHI19618.1 hypothetical protein SAMN02745129_4714 [Ferrimonas marina]
MDTPSFTGDPSMEWWHRLQPLRSVLKQMGLPHRRDGQNLLIPLGPFRTPLKVRYNPANQGFDFHTGWLRAIGITGLVVPYAIWILFAQQVNGLSALCGGLYLMFSLVMLADALYRENLANTLRLGLVTQGNSASRTDIGNQQQGKPCQ